MGPLRIFQAVNSSVIVVHLISRVLDRKKILDDVAKERFRQLTVAELVEFGRHGKAKPRPREARSR